MIETIAMLLNEFVSLMPLTILEYFCCCHLIEQFVLMLIDLLEQLILSNTDMAFK
jgi:hypothetical protein